MTNIDSLLNIGAFGIYNKADAAVTMHCLYDPDTQECGVEFIYYIIDLYGVSAGVASWKKNENINTYWLY